MPFFRFRQNNSGGSFDVTETLTISVFIEANDAYQANNKLITLGGYFDGVQWGRDCDCCGDRWHYVDDDDAEQELPPLEVTTKQYFGTPAGRQTVVHYANNATKWF